jgi:hypothetical protein
MFDYIGVKMWEIVGMPEPIFHADLPDSSMKTG